MIFYTILAFTLLLLAYAFHKLYLQPKKLIKYYSNLLSSNFKVYAYPFVPLQPNEFVQTSIDERKHKDAFKTYKQVCSEFDVTISTVVDKVQLNFVSPKFMQAFYQLDNQNFYKKNELIINGLKRMVGLGLTFAAGEVWKMKRRVTTKMLNFTYVRSLVPKIQQIVRQKIKELMDKAQPDSQWYTQIDIFDLTTQIASTVILQLFFGGGTTNVNDLRIKEKTVNDHMRKLLELLERQLLTNPLVIIFGQKYCKLGITQLDRQVNVLLADFNSFTSLFIRKRLTELQKLYQEGRQHPQVYTDLIQAYYVQEILKKKQETSQQFIQSLVDEFATLLVAGTETTSHAALMSIYYTFKHNDIKQELRAQIKKNIPSFDELSYESFKHCTLLQAILTENIRMYSSANGIFPRQALEDHLLTVDGMSFPIKKGTLINSHNICIHYKQSIYNEPEKFKPHRFIDNQRKLVNPEPFTLMNFSAGARSCVGKQLALTEQRIVLSYIADNYEIKVEDSEKQMVFCEFAYNLKNVKFLVKPLQ